MKECEEGNKRYMCTDVPTKGAHIRKSITHRTFVMVHTRLEVRWTGTIIELNHRDERLEWWNNNIKKEDKRGTPRHNLGRACADSARISLDCETYTSIDVYNAGE